MKRIMTLIALIGVALIFASPTVKKINIANVFIPDSLVEPPKQKFDLSMFSPENTHEPDLSFLTCNTVQAVSFTAFVEEEDLTACYEISGEGEVELKLINLLGVEVQPLMYMIQDAGTYEYSWSMEGLPSGQYLLSVRVGHKERTEKIIKV